MNEALAVPNLEASADAWHVYPMGVLYRGVVIDMLGVDRIVDIIAVIDEMNSITSHNPYKRARPIECPPSCTPSMRGSPRLPSAYWQPAAA
jgi:hypothetical protein